MRLKFKPGDRFTLLKDMQVGLAVVSKYFQGDTGTVIADLNQYDPRADDPSYVVMMDRDVENGNKRQADRALRNLCPYYSFSLGSRFMDAHRIMYTHALQQRVSWNSCAWRPATV